MASWYSTEPPSEDSSKLRMILLMHVALLAITQCLALSCNGQESEGEKTHPIAHATCSFCIRLIPVNLKQGQGHQA